MKIHLPPAHYVVVIFGGVNNLAKALGLSKSRVSWWQTKRGKSQDRLIPSKHQKKILEVALERGLDITSHDLIYGREVIEK